MDLVLRDFKLEIRDLQEHLNYIQEVSTVIPSTNRLYSYVNSTTKKKFNYKSLIITFYGIIEQYSERFITAYLDEINNRIPTYIDLKPKIKESHLFNSVLLASKILENKHHKYSSLDIKSVIANLDGCLKNDVPYSFNTISYTILSGNLKHSKICDFFKQIDLNLEQLFDKLTDFKNIKSENKYQKIDDLVERRNEIAHGSLSNILDISEFPDYIDFLEKYFVALYDVLKYDIEQQILSYKVKTKCIELENPKVFGGNIIGFVNSKKIWFRIHKKIIVQKSTGELSKYNISNMSFFKSTNEVTLKLNGKTNLKDNQKFFLIK